MPIPQYQVLMLPVLELARDSQEHSLREAYDTLAQQFDLGEEERKERLPSGQQVLVTDTVGVIYKLPPMVVAAFRATREELQEASLLLHMVDVTHHNAQEQVRVVEHLFRWREWQIVEEDAPHTKLDQGTAEWRLDVPANGEKSLNYTVLYEF